MSLALALGSKSLVLEEEQRGFFVCGVISMWNSLPDSVSFTGLSAYKRSIRTVDFNEFLKCDSS